MAYLGLLKGEKEYDFIDIRNAIWWWEYKRTVIALLMPYRVFEQLRWKAKRDGVNSFWWAEYRKDEFHTFGKLIVIDERVSGIEYLIEEDAP